MLTACDEETANRNDDVSPTGTNVMSEATGAQVPSGAVQGRLARALSVEWLGQMAASLCWIASVFSYGISATGDWLQLCAASTWLLANIAAIVTVGAD